LDKRRVARGDVLSTTSANVAISLNVSQKIQPALGPRPENQVKFRRPASGAYSQSTGGPILVSLHAAAGVGEAMGALVNSQRRRTIALVGDRHPP
jgi:hypothetical protein